MQQATVTFVHVLCQPPRLTSPKSLANPVSLKQAKTHPALTRLIVPTVSPSVSTRGGADQPGKRGDDVMVGMRAAKVQALITDRSTVSLTGESRESKSRFVVIHRGGREWSVVDVDWRGLCGWMRRDEHLSRNASTPMRKATSCEVPSIWHRKGVVNPRPPQLSGMKGRSRSVAKAARQVDFYSQKTSLEKAFIRKKICASPLSSSSLPSWPLSPRASPL